ncbi:MAG: hypothetical protein ACLQVY_00460 [Limisphaerales bacterium]
MSIGHWDIKQVKVQPTTAKVEYPVRPPVAWECLNSETPLESHSILENLPDDSENVSERQPDPKRNESHLSSSRFNPLVAGENQTPNFKPKNTFLRPLSDDNDHEKLVSDARKKVGPLSVDDLPTSNRPKDTA